MDKTGELLTEVTERIARQLISVEFIKAPGKYWHAGIKKWDADAEKDPDIKGMGKGNSPAEALQNALNEFLAGRAALEEEVEK